MILHRVDGNGLEAAPTERDHERVAIFQDSFVPAMFFKADLNESDAAFAAEKTAGDDGETSVEIRHEFARNRVKFWARMRTVEWN